MINKKKTVAIIAATQYLRGVESIKPSKISWTDNRESGWSNQNRNNWNKTK